MVLAKQLLKLPYLCCGQNRTTNQKFVTILEYVATSYDAHTPLFEKLLDDNGGKVKLILTTLTVHMKWEVETLLLDEIPTYQLSSNITVAETNITNEKNRENCIIIDGNKKSR